MNDSSMKKILTAKEVASDYFGGYVTYGTVLAMTQRNDLPAHKIGARYLYWREELDRWREQGYNKTVQLHEESQKERERTEWYYE